MGLIQYTKFSALNTGPRANGLYIMHPQLLTPDPPVIGNVVFRRALMMGIDRQEMADVLGGGVAPVAHTILDTDDFSVRGISAQLLKGTALNEHYLTPRDSVRKTWNNWMRLRRRKRLPQAKATLNGGGQ